MFVCPNYIESHIRVFPECFRVDPFESDLSVYSQRFIPFQSHCTAHSTLFTQFLLLITKQFSLLFTLGSWEVEELVVLVVVPGTGGKLIGIGSGRWPAH